MTVSDKDPIDLYPFIVVQIVTEVAQKLLVTLWKVTWVDQSLERTTSNYVTVCPLERVGTRILYVDLSSKVSQTLPGLT